MISPGERKSPKVRPFAGTRRFVVRSCLGAGATGVVYEAFDREKQSAVALKLLDRTDNLQDVARIVADRREFAERYLKKTRREFAPLLERCRHAYVRDVFEERVAALEKALERRR